MMKAIRVEALGSVGCLSSISVPTLNPGEVLIRSTFSSLNYKDALAVTSHGAILKSFPLTPGIDVAGTVEHSLSSQFQKGDEVFINGSGLGETIDGGFAQYVKAPESIVMRLPAGLSRREAMSLGTAGFTAALSLYRMEQLDQTPAKGPIVVTGASGGVGVVAIQLLRLRGYEVIAVTGKPQTYDLLKSFGAHQVLAPDELNLGSRPLESVRFGGVIDNVGGQLLSQLASHVTLWGNVTSIGLAASADLQTTVMPLILRGVSILGVSSANCPQPLREKIWQLLATSWKIPHLSTIVRQTLPLENVVKASQDLLSRKLFGRTLIEL